jgi:hypothetical protein
LAKKYRLLLENLKQLAIKFWASFTYRTPRSFFWTHRGIHAAKEIFNIRIVELALSSIGDVDVVLLIADISKPDRVSEKILLRTLSGGQKTRDPCPQ